MNDLDWNALLEYFLLLAAAYALTLPIGWDQEREHGAAGIRVFPFLGVGSCAYILLAYEVIPEQTAESHARMLVGLMSGIGFLSGGAILKDKSGNNARGIATAASMWVTATVGAAVGLREFNLAILISVIVFLTHKLLRPMKPFAKGQHKGVDNDHGEENDFEDDTPDTGRARRRSSATARDSHNLFAGVDVAERTHRSANLAESKATEVASEAIKATPPEGTRASIMGILVAYKDIAVKGLTHRVGIIRDEKESEYLVDLGPAEHLNNLALARGMYLMVHGVVAMLGARQGLRATQVVFNGGVIDIGA